MNEAPSAMSAAVVTSPRTARSLRSGAALCSMLADATTDAKGEFRLKAVRFDGEAVKEGARFSVGVVVANEGKKLVQDVVISNDKRERELEVQLGK